MPAPEISDHRILMSIITSDSEIYVLRISAVPWSTILYLDWCALIALLLHLGSLRRRHLRFLPLVRHLIIDDLHRTVRLTLFAYSSSSTTSLRSSVALRSFLSLLLKTRELLAVFKSLADDILRSET